MVEVMVREERVEAAQEAEDTVKVAVTVKGVAGSAAATEAAAATRVMAVAPTAAASLVGWAPMVALAVEARNTQRNRHSWRTCTCHSMTWC